jgi:hypothetical protein
MIGKPGTMEFPWMFQEVDLSRSVKDKGNDWSGRRGA